MNELMSLYQITKAKTLIIKWNQQNDQSSRCCLSICLYGKWNCLEPGLIAPSGFSAEGLHGEFEPANKPSTEVPSDA